MSLKIKLNRTKTKFLTISAYHVFVARSENQENETKNCFMCNWLLIEVLKEEMQRVVLEQMSLTENKNEMLMKVSQTCAHIFRCKE